jgi:type IV secretory pathway VirJ component
MSQKKMIVVDENTHSRLRQMGKKDETYDSIIRRMINDQQKNKPGQTASNEHAPVTTADKAGGSIDG